MNNISKIILAIIGIIVIIIIVYIYTLPRYNPYQTILSPSPVTSSTPSPSTEPSITPPPSISSSPKISLTPTSKPSVTPSPKPSVSPTPKPSASPTQTPTPTPKIDTFNISAIEYGYNPNSITVRSGDTVKINFTDNGAYSHNLTIEGLNIATPTLNPGQTATIQFTAPAAGTYTFFCSVDSHRDLGLTGTLIVQ